MNNLTASRIGELVVEALERTAFLLADTIDEVEAAELPAATRFARITFSGAAEGSIVLSASEGFVQELASSLLGVEPDQVDPDNEGRDALNELANIVGGSVILQLGGAEKQYQYGLPRALAKEEVPKDSPGMIKCFVESEGELLSVGWLPHPGSSAAAA